MLKKIGKDFAYIKLAGYKNINELFVQDSQLHACETLFGDWDSEVMILAQDAANFFTLKSLYEKDNSNPFHHDYKNRTNVNLFELMLSLSRFNLSDYRIPNNRSCGLYYANAIWMLKDSKTMSGPITNKESAYKESAVIFKATLENLPKLKLIITLGQHSFNFIKYYFKNQVGTEWHSTVTNRKLHEVQSDGLSYLVGSIYHTSNRGMIARARCDGFTGKNSCTKGIQLTSHDLNQIFLNFDQINKK